MHVQWCVKGIGGQADNDPGPLLTKNEAIALVASGVGILSNWWRHQQTVRLADIPLVVTEQNLDRHLHDYAGFGRQTPFISLACGSVERDSDQRANYAWSAEDTALMFATADWSRPGALYYCWVVTTLTPAVELVSVAEPVRDLLIYRRWSPYQLEGEVTAKVHLPANQISRVDWWDPSQSRAAPCDSYRNPSFASPTPLLNVRDLF